MLGLAPTGPPTAWTISLGDPDEMARRAAAASGRFRCLKLQLGGMDGLDVERVRAVRAASALPLVVDVNEFWSFDEALDALQQLAPLGVLHCEQPLPAGHLDGPALKRRSPVPLVADMDSADVAHAAERAHGVNVKLAKAGGIREALRTIDAARSHGLSVTVGCMNESSLAIAAAAQIQSAADHADLDGALLLRADPWSGPRLRDGVQVVSDEPGLGVRRAS
jgi:L-alanine-DL-glutamate epimerase-like enolase superfamily enzyme